MSRRKPRGLRPEEEALWQQVSAKTRPLHNRPRAAPGKTQPPVPDPSARSETQDRPPLKPFRMGQKARTGGAPNDLAPDLMQHLGGAPVRMDRKAFTRMKRGKLQPEARIDLHGMTMAQAYPVLIRFIMGAQAQGHRLVLVITGKGRTPRDDGPIPERHGILRHQVPDWLNQPPLAGLVMQVHPAHLRHGGGGAYYVYLRRGR